MRPGRTILLSWSGLGSVSFVGARVLRTAAGKGKGEGESECECKGEGECELEDVRGAGVGLRVILVFSVPLTALQH